MILQDSENISSVCRLLVSRSVHSEKPLYDSLNLKGIWSEQQFFFSLWTKRTSFWFIIQRKTVTTILFLSIWSQSEKNVSMCNHVQLYKNINLYIQLPMHIHCTVDLLFIQFIFFQLVFVQRFSSNPFRPILT